MGSHNSNRNYQNTEGQITLFDILAKMQSGDMGLTSNDISKAIEELQAVKKKTKEREKEEQRKREALEQKRQKLKEEEEKNNHILKVTSMDLPLDWENVFDGDPRTEGVHVDSISDGLIMSLTNLARVDIEYISSVTGVDYKSVISALKGSIYQNPNTWNECFYKGWETADEYLSGNLMNKWRKAREANVIYNGYFSENIKALEKVMPSPVPTKDIYITLGSPWVPTDIIDDFIIHLFGHSHFYTNAKVMHDEVTGTWEIPEKGRYYHGNVATTQTYGTPRLQALFILEKTLNMKTVAVYDEVKTNTTESGKRRVVNESETVMAIEKQNKLIKEFQDWVWKDKARKERLEMIYENKYSCIRRRIFDGSYLTFPNMSKDIKLYPYQKNAIARILYSPNTLLAHDVGAGKTYVMIAAGMELKRMGISTKNLYVVPNNIVGQWKSIFESMYPEANVLAVEPKNFRPAKREEMLEKIRDEDFDGIIMAYSCFERIPLSKEYYIEEIQEIQTRISKMLENKKKQTKNLNKKKDKLNDMLWELEMTINDMDESIYFDELGITRMFVDEAHNYKNVPLETKVDKVLGISPGGSKKCQDMMDKVRMIQKQNNGAGVVMATGTPITNSITDVFVMQKYLQSGELALLDLQSFDSWVGMFAERVTEFEIDVDTSSYRLATRFAKFHNLPELTTMLSSIADFHSMDGSSEIPDFEGYDDALISKTQAFSDYLKAISKRADAVRHGMVDRRTDNMLKITTDGRKAALDLRLVDPNLKFTYQSKVARSVENVFDIYVKTEQQRGTQIIFCDTSTPKAGFNLYDEIKRLLIVMGIKESEIEFVYSADTEAKRKKLFDKMQKGEIRVLLGSTFKIGIGVNVQNKLYAIHHLDVPWRPADMIQREGRILRQGNENQQVYIYRYITEGSFDAYSWQLLETKQRFITDILSGSMEERVGSDVTDTVLDYAEVKALAVGNPLVKERVEAANELTRYRTLQRKLVESRLALEKELAELPNKIYHQNKLINNCIKDKDFYLNQKMDEKELHTSQEKKQEIDARRSLRKKLHEAILDNVLETRERFLLEYKGFKVILPANMKKEKPYLYLQREGRYYVELGDSDVGYLVRIDNVLDELESRQEKLNEGLKKMRDRESGIKLELAKKESYADKIEEYQKKVEKLDEKLGVKK